MGQVRSQVQDDYLAEKEALVNQIADLANKVNELKQQEVEYQNRIGALVVSHENTIEKMKLVMRERAQLRDQLNQGVAGAASAHKAADQSAVIETLKSHIERLLHDLEVKDELIIDLTAKNDKLGSVVQSYANLVEMDHNYA